MAGSFRQPFHCSGLRRASTLRLSGFRHEHHPMCARVGLLADDVGVELQRDTATPVSGVRLGVRALWASILRRFRRRS
jgi:hypothetical protein